MSIAASQYISHSVLVASSHGQPIPNHSFEQTRKNPISFRFSLLAGTYRVGGGVRTDAPFRACCRIDWNWRFWICLPKDPFVFEVDRKRGAAKRERKTIWALVTIFADQLRMWLVGHGRSLRWLFDRVYTYGSGDFLNRLASLA